MVVYLYSDNNNIKYKIMENKVLEFIEFLRQNTKVADVYSDTGCSGFNYYHNVTGWADGKYYNVTMFGIIKGQGVSHCFEISDHVTDCYDLIEWLCYEFGLKKY